MPVRELLARAAELAAEHRFRVMPNPPVGCVVVRSGRIIGEGAHRYWGGPHAEVEALRAAGSAARGATVYVTLEPCGHMGKTPPCADALIRAGVREVVYAHPDPNPRTAGVGPARLREAGIKVRALRSPAAVRRLLRPYLRHLDSRRPWVIAKWAMTLDGRVATRTGQSRWITSEKARRWAHRHLRGRVDAILVGAGTVRLDDPELTNRSGHGGQPARVVVCGRRKLPPKSKLLTDGKPTLLLTPDFFSAPAGIETMACGRGGRVELHRALRKLRGAGLHRTLVEGGSDLLGSLFDRGHVDQVAVFVEPKIIGGIGALAPVGGRGLATMDSAFEVEDSAEQVVDTTYVLEGFVAPRER